MLILLRYAFYRTYKLALSMGRRQTEALIVLLSFPIIANVCSLESCIYILMRHRSSGLTFADKIVAGIIYFTAIYAMNRYLATEKRIKAIFKEFENISNKEKYRLNFLAIVYPLVSVLLAVFLANIIRAKEYLEW